MRNNPKSAIISIVIFSILKVVIISVVVLSITSFLITETQGQHRTSEMRMFCAPAAGAPPDLPGMIREPLVCLPGAVSRLLPHCAARPPRLTVEGWRTVLERTVDTGPHDLRPLARWVLRRDLVDSTHVAVVEGWTTIRCLSEPLPEPKRSCDEELPHPAELRRWFENTVLQLGDTGRAIIALLSGFEQPTESLAWLHAELRKTERGCPE